MSADSHSKMGVGKKIRRILSFKKKKEEKPAIEAPAKADKTSTLNGTKGKSSSLMSLGRKLSFGKRDKANKDKSKKSAPAASETVATPTVAQAIATIPLAAQEIVETVPTVETPAPQTPAVSESAVQEVEIVSNEIASEQLSESGNPMFEKVKPHDKLDDTKDEEAEGDGIKLATGQPDSLSEEQSDKPSTVSSDSEKHCKVLSTAPVTAADEPRTMTEVINKIHDKSETNQTGDEFVRIVEVEQERTLAEDGTTVISRQTKTTTTTVDRASEGNVNQVKTEFKNEVLAPKSNGVSRVISQRSARKSSGLRLHLVVAAITAALAIAFLYKLKELGFSLV